MAQQTLDLKPIEEDNKLDLQPLDLQPVAEEPKTEQKPTLLDTAKKYGKRILYGATREEMGADKAGIKDIQGPGFSEIPGARSLAEGIRKYGRNTGNYWAGAGSSIAGDLIDLGASGVDPRAAFVGKEPLHPKTDLPFSRNRLLPEHAGPDGKPTPGYILPPSGIKGEAAPFNSPPEVAAKVGGLVDHPNTSSQAHGTAFDPKEIAERKRIDSLKYGQAEQYPGTRLKIEDKGLSLPRQDKDTIGGFNESTDKPMSYPYNVVPDRLRPRAAQSEVLGSSGLKGMDLSTPSNVDSDIGFISDKGSDVIPDKPERYNANGMTTGEGDLPSAKVVTKKGLMGEDSKPPIDTVKDTIDFNDNENKPFKDINSISAQVRSADRVLESRPESAPIAKLVKTANDTKLQWIATTERDLAGLTKGLTKTERTLVGKLLDNPSSVPNADANLVQSAMKIRAALTKIHSLIPDGSGPTGENVGFIEHYLTHIEKQPDDIKSAIKSIWDYHLGEPAKAMFSTETSGTGGFINKSKGNNPTSPFVKVRTGGIKDIELDVNKVLPAYVESIAKVIYDKPAVAEAKGILDTIPDSKLKELAGHYLRNYTRYDSMPGLSEAWNKWSGRAARTLARSTLGFNTGLQTLHLARIPANLYPELGEKYMAYGAKVLGKSPIKSWHEAASLGLLQNEVRPMAFKTPMEKLDSVLQFGQIADYLDKAIGYHGFKKMYMDKGMSEAEASIKALDATKKASLTIDPSRSALGFHPEGGNMSTASWRLTTQFKQVPAKIIEQYVTIIAQAKRNPKQAARALAGVGLAASLYKFGGMRTFHLSPDQVIPAGGKDMPVGRAIYNIYDELYNKKNLIGALEQTALWLTPAGKSVQRQIESGPSFMEPPPRERDTDSSPTIFRIPR